MAKRFDKIIYVYEQDGKPKYALTALKTLRKDLLAQGFKLPSAVTMKAHLDKKQLFESGSVKIYELGLFKTEYSSDQVNNLKVKEDEY